MKKKLFCIILACFLFVGVPVKGYAASLSPLVFGMSEDVVLAFLASLLGVSAKQTINTYADLTAYDNDLRLGFTEYMAGSATALQVAEWIQQAAVGNIDKSSIIWQKFYEYCMSQYVASSAGTQTNANSILNTPSFPFVYGSSFTVTGPYGTPASGSDIDAFVVYAAANNSYASFNVLQASYNPHNQFGTYTYDNKTVYYKLSGHTGNFGPISVSPSDSFFVGTNYFNNVNNSNAGKCAWAMLYDASTASENVASISGSFNGVLTSSETNDLFDGTSVLQLYNPAMAQNGLQIVPDPGDPNDIEVPAMLTADWYNFLKQFGPSGASQFVAAYNALNAVQGVSTGAIDAIYNSLGIASAISSATQAAQGTLTLTDNNVFPHASTIADAVNGVIPGALTPQAPEAGIDNDSEQGLYKLPDLKDFFPFCIPFDLIDLLSCFIAEPETPQFVIALSTGEDTVTGQMDLHIWDNIASVLRGLELMAFTVGLILITRNIIRG